MKTKKASLGHEFVEELIRLFFNPKSYFYHSFESLLRTERPRKTADARSVELIDNLFFLLSRATDPNSILKEVSHLKGFEDFYSSLKDELITIQANQPGKIDTKAFISKLADKTFNGWKIRLSDPALQKYLYTYIKLKQSLLNLLENTNGSDTYLESVNIENLLSDTSAISQFDTSPLANTDKETQQKENHAFRKFFEEELKNTLAPIDIDFKEIQSEKSSADYLQAAREIFEKVLELANFHDYTKVKQICQETLAFLERIAEPEHIFTLNDYNLLQAAREHIIKSVAKPNSNGLHEFLHSLRHGKLDSPPAETEKEQEKHDESNQDSQQVEYNTLLAKEIEPETPENIEENNLAPAPLFQDGDQIHFSLPGEENEELINLIKDVSLSMNIPQKTETGTADLDKSSTPPIDYQSLKDVGEREAYQTFAQQAKPMAKIIFESLKLLKEDYIQYAHVMEDIELASASLKHLAKKLDLQKLAFFPELVESICINVSLAELKIPTGFLASIAKGIKHLLSYDPADENHEAILIDILSELKRYYAHTVRVIEQKQLASS